MSPLPDVDSWLAFLGRQIAQHGRDNEHPSYRNPGLAHDLCSRWAAMRDGPGDPAAIAALDAQFDQIAEREGPHSMWWELRRAFREWQWRVRG